MTNSLLNVQGCAVTKVCTLCKVEKLLNEFSPHKRHKYGVYSRCKICCNKTTKEWQAENPEKTKENKKRQAKKEKSVEYHREYLKKYRKNNPEKYREINRRWEEKNKERVLIAKKAGSELKNALRKGVVKKINKCEFCGSENKAIEGAHYDYNKPLEVKWLCRSCHRKWDKESPKTI